MDLDHFLARLEKLRWFEGYSAEAAAKARQKIRRNHQAGLKGSQKSAFERFPGLALVVLEVDLELSGTDDLKVVLQQFGQASFGMFAPQKIRVRWEDESNRCRLEFSVNATKHRLVFDDISWMPSEFFEELDKITRSECSGLMFHDIEYPDPGQSAFYVWCTKRAFQAITRAGLIPSAKHPLSGKPPPPPPPKEVPNPDPADVLGLAPPKDPARAERMGIFRRGKWRIPSLSEKRLLAWQEVAAAKPATLAGSPLAARIRDAFDLLCARHCGLRGIGEAATYAKQTVALVERYFFGDWREGYVEDGRTFTEAELCKDLLWWTELPSGCAAALFLNQPGHVSRFLEYPRFDIYDESVEHDLAYYRLLSDFVRGESGWDWTEQTAIIANGPDQKRYSKLVPCLAALRAGDERAFRKAILKFATKPLYTPPVTFEGVVDADVTLLVGLARQKDWSCDGFPERLEDRILNARSVS